MAKHTKMSSNKKLIIILLSIILFCSIVLIIRIKIDEYINNQKQIEISQVIDTIDIPDIDITHSQTERMLQVIELQKENPEVVGWLEIEGTNISYPVCQTNNNEYYLTYSYKKEKVTGGSPFLDKDYSFIRPSDNLLIYGHRNTKGLLFEDLIKYQDENFYKEHKKIRFTTAIEDSTYEVMSAFNSRVYYQDEQNVFRYYYFVNAENKSEYDEFIENCKEASLYETGVTAEYGDQLLTLSTCEYTQKDGRFAVVARKIKNNNLK